MFSHLLEQGLHLRVVRVSLSFCFVKCARLLVMVVISSGRHGHDLDVPNSASLSRASLTSSFFSCCSASSFPPVRNSHEDFGMAENSQSVTESRDEKKNTKYEISTWKNSLEQRRNPNPNP